MPNDSTPGVLARLFSTPELHAIFGERAGVQALLDFEAALARAEARVGAIPAAAVAPIERACRVERIDLAALAEAAPAAGNPLIPLVRQLGKLVAADDPQAAPYVHWGATSQDAMDTALVLQLRAALDWLEPTLGQLADAAAELAERHARTPLAGRTWLQQALPVTFGLKAAGWLDALGRHRERLARLRGEALVLQFGGAAGTLASLGARGLDVAQALADELGLALPALPWHAQRDRIAETGTVLALLVGTLGKIARDVSLLAQTEVGEAAEPAEEGRGGSSSMPHKRNPVRSALVLSAAVRAPGLAATLLAAMVQEHERGLGGWHAEWSALPELCEVTGGALAQALPMLRGLRVDAARMAANLGLTGGQLMAEAVKLALAPRLGGAESHALVERACRRADEQGRPLLDVLTADAAVTAVLPPPELASVLDPARYLGVSAELIERALAAHRRFGR